MAMVLGLELGIRLQLGLGHNSVLLRNIYVITFFVLVCINKKTGSAVYHFAHFSRNVHCGVGVQHTYCIDNETYNSNPSL